jgi:hypothetical protein
VTSSVFLLYFVNKILQCSVAIEPLEFVPVILEAAKSLRGYCGGWLLVLICSERKVLVSGLS